MALDSIETGPDKQESAIAMHFSEVMQDVDGDFDAAVLGLSTSEDALLFLMGRVEDLRENHGNRDCLGLVICEIGQVISKVEDVEERFRLRQDIWESAFEAIKAKENAIPGWETMRRAVHLFDASGEKLIFR